MAQGWRVTPSAGAQCGQEAAGPCAQGGAIINRCWLCRPCILASLQALHPCRPCILASLQALHPCRPLRASASALQNLEISNGSTALASLSYTLESYYQACALHRCARSFLNEPTSGWPPSDSAQDVRVLLHRHRVCLENSVQGILSARVPIIRFTDRTTGAFPVVSGAKALWPKPNISQARHLSGLEALSPCFDD